MRKKWKIWVFFPLFFTHTLHPYQSFPSIHSCQSLISFPWIPALCQMWGWLKQSQFYRLPFCPTGCILCLREAFQFDEVPFIYCVLNVCTISILFSMQSPATMHSRIFPTFSSIWFSIQDFMLRCLIYLHLSFVQGFRYG